MSQKNAGTIVPPSGPTPAELALAAVQAKDLQMPAEVKPLLMTRDNPAGMKLEDLLEKLRDELVAKNEILGGRLSTSLEAESLKELILSNNDQIIRLLSQAMGIQRISVKELDKFAPDQGPLGEPRV